ncbi:MAG TPA: hypothetical protein VED16_05225 [Candidatus Acidoferrum sp.]|nr:hypothetical protein [Candidatus Acidoferrum sp.]
MIVNSIFYLTMLFVAAMSFIFTLVVTKPLIKRMKTAGIYGTDVHKPNKPEISEMGGFAIYGGVVTALTITAFVGFNVQVLIVALLVISLSAVVGVLDDIMKLGAKEKPLLGYLAGIPLLLTAKEAPYVLIPFLGIVWIGLAWLPIVPFGVTGGANAVNTFAGFNGMEVGCGAIVTASLIIVGLTILPPTGAIEGLLILAALFGALLGFFVYNKYPAKIFCGDTGTLCIGSAIAVGVIASKIEFFALIALLPYIINYAMVLFSVRKVTDSHRFSATQVTEEGYLQPSQSYNIRKNLSDYILKRKSMKEPQLVRTLWVMCSVSGLLSILVASLSHL